MYWSIRKCNRDKEYAYIIQHGGHKRNHDHPYGLTNMELRRNNMYICCNYMDHIFILILMKVWWDTVIYNDQSGFTAEPRIIYYELIQNDNETKINMCNDHNSIRSIHTWSKWNWNWNRYTYWLGWNRISIKVI